MSSDSAPPSSSTTARRNWTWRAFVVIVIVLICVQVFVLFRILRPPSGPGDLNAIGSGGGPGGGGMFGGPPPGGPNGSGAPSSQSIHLFGWAPTPDERLATFAGFVTAVQMSNHKLTDEQRQKLELLTKDYAETVLSLATATAKMFTALEEGQQMIVATKMPPPGAPPPPGGGDNPVLMKFITYVENTAAPSPATTSSSAPDLASARVPHVPGFALCAGLAALETSSKPLTAEQCRTMLPLLKSLPENSKKLFELENKLQRVFTPEQLEVKGLQSCDAVGRLLVNSLSARK